MSRRVSVVIPCYNHGRYLAEAIECCLAQTHRDVEIVVVDDGSTDQTPQVMAAYAGRISGVRQANSGGVGGARNGAMAHVTGDYVQFLDADDRIQPDKLAEQVAALERSPQAGACWTDGWLIDSRGERLGPANINHPSGHVLHSLLSMWGTQVAAVLVRRAALDAVAQLSADGSRCWFDTSSDIRGCEDLDLWLRLAAKFEFVTLDEKLFEYRVGNQSMSSNTVMMLRSGLAVLKRNATHHGDCDECRAAIRAGRRRWKTVAAYGLMQQARQLVAERRWVRAAGRVASVARHHPAHLAKVMNPVHYATKLRAITGGSNA